jgi:hypothetical protein
MVHNAQNISSEDRFYRRFVTIFWSGPTIEISEGLKTGCLKAISPESFGATKWPYNWSAVLVFLVQPALQDQPFRSRGALRPRLAEHRPKTDPSISGQTAFRYPKISVPYRCRVRAVAG